MNNNESFIATLKNIRPIEGADKIKLADVTLNNIPITQIVVGADTQEGLKVVYFDSNMALEDSTVISLDKVSIGYGTEDFTSVGKYLAKGNRVKVVKLRQQISNGLAIEVAKFFQFFKSETEAMKILVEGFSFTELNGVKICHKWLPPVNNKNSGKGNKEHKGKKKNETKIISGHFPEHKDTDQLIRNIHRINPNDCIQISEKWHGTSSRCGYVLTNRNLSVIEKFFKLFGMQIKDYEYHYVYGSRRVTKKIDSIKDKKEKKHFYSYDLWTDAGEKYFKGKLQKGEVVYYEIVGELPDGAPIQKIGKNVYNYGVPHNQYGIYVYRITLTNEDGFTVEYDSQTVKERCKELCVKHVNELYYGLAKDKYPFIDLNEDWHKSFLENLKKEYLNKTRTDCFSPKTYDEGVVIRREVGIGIDAFKLKSELFLNSESAALDEETVIDIEV